MWSRFQIGSKSPLAKRKARMFWAASLPKKWSMRKTCSSSKILYQPSLRPEWRADYFAANIGDPDGYNIEIAYKPWLYK